MEHTSKQNSFRLDVNMPSPRTSGTHRLLAEVKKKTLRSRILTALFGEQNEIIIILPSRNVNNVTFNRAETGPYDDAWRGAGSKDAAHSDDAQMNGTCVNADHTSDVEVSEQTASENASRKGALRNEVPRKD